MCEAMRDILTFLKQMLKNPEIFNILSKACIKKLIILT